MQLFRALLNPTRIRILDAVAKSPASPDQLAARFEESPSIISYHVRVLRATGCLRPASTTQADREGKCTYELVPFGAPIRSVAQPQTAPSMLSHPSAAVLRTSVDRGIASLDTGPLGGHKGDRLGYVSIVLDGQGWQTVSAAIDDALDRVSIAHEESAKRLADAEEQGIGATIAVASFKSSPPAAAPD